MDSNAVLAEVTCTWGAGGEALAVLLHQAPEMLVLEASNPRIVLPPLGTEVGVATEHMRLSGRIAEHGHAGRFLLSIGSRPVRSSARVKVSLPGTLRSLLLSEPVPVEIADLTTSGARVRGVELPVDTQVSLDFTPPGRIDLVSVRALVVHTTHGADRPWLGVRFRLVALRGGR